MLTAVTPERERPTEATECADGERGAILGQRNDIGSVVLKQRIHLPRPDSEERVAVENSVY